MHNKFVERTSITISKISELLKPADFVFVKVNQCNMTETKPLLLILMIVLMNAVLSNGFSTLPTSSSLEIRTSKIDSGKTIDSLRAASVSMEQYSRRSIRSRIKEKIAEKWQNGRRVQIVKDVVELQRIVNDETQDIIAVMFYSPVCKACNAAKPLFSKLAKKYKEVKFISVPMTPENSQHLKSMNVNQFPFGHIYKPREGLVESAGLLRKMIPNFEKSIQAFISGSPMELELSDDEE